jgi:ProP effector
MSNWRATNDAAIALLVERYPKTFAVYEARRRPLKIGIDRDLVAALGGAMTPRELGSALRCYCSNEGYLRNMLKGAWRVDLDGNPCGAVTGEAETHARETLAAKRRKAPKPAPAPEPPQPKRLSLADLRAAAIARRQNSTTGRPARDGTRP